MASNPSEADSRPDVVIEIPASHECAAEIYAGLVAAKEFCKAHQFVLDSRDIANCLALVCRTWRKIHEKETGIVNFVPLRLLEALVEGDPCEMNQQGGCDTHGYLDLPPDQHKCPQQELKELIARHAEAGR